MEGERRREGESHSTKTKDVLFQIIFLSFDSAQIRQRIFFVCVCVKSCLVSSQRLSKRWCHSLNHKGNRKEVAAASALILTFNLLVVFHYETSWNTNCVSTKKGEQAHDWHSHVGRGFQPYTSSARALNLRCGESANYTCAAERILILLNGTINIMMARLHLGFSQPSHLLWVARYHQFDDQK